MAAAVRAALQSAQLGTGSAAQSFGHRLVQDRAAAASRQAAFDAGKEAALVHPSGMDPLDDAAAVTAGCLSGPLPAQDDGTSPSARRQNETGRASGGQPP